MMRTVDFAELPRLVGCDLGYSRWLLIDQDRIDRFADVTDDHQWIHTDPARARPALGHTIAHGYLTLSLIPTLSRDILEVRGVSRALNYGSNRLRYISAVPVGSSIRLHQRVLSVEQKAGGLQMVSEYIIQCTETDRPACTSEQIVLFIR